MAVPTKTILKPYVALHKQKTRLEAELADTKERMKEMEPVLTKSFTDEGLQSINLDGHTVYLNRQIWAGADDKDDMIKVLKAMDDDTWRFLVADNVNSSKLSARVRECERDDDNMPILPAELRPVIKVAEVFRIGVRKAGAK